MGIFDRFRKRPQEPVHHEIAAEGAAVNRTAVEARKTTSDPDSEGAIPAPAASGAAPEAVPTPQTGSSAQPRYAVYTDIGSRKANEDSVRVKVLSGKRICLIVADGLGGHGGGDRASQTAAAHVIESWDGETDAETIRRLLTEANAKVLAMQTPLCQMKTTIVLLVVDGSRFLRAHVGDSRLYHFHDGRLVYQTRDHSVAQMSVLLGEITPDQIRFHEDRSRVLRALGQDERLNVEAAEETPEPGTHAFLLCTDGFWEYVLEEEMEEDLRSADSPEDWLGRMRVRLAVRVKEMYGDVPENDNNTAAALWLELH